MIQRSQKIAVAAFSLLLIFNAKVFAAEGSIQGAVVTRSEGDAKFLIKKAGEAPKGTTSVVFENQTFFVRALKAGDRPANGDVITTGKDGKVRLIFRNGDQITVTPSSAFKFSWDSKTDKNAVAEVVYGDIRSVIQPGGPRSGMQVKTKSAVMGVRGTDFYASAWSSTGGSKVAVMRGNVAVAAIKKDGGVTAETNIPSGSAGVVKAVETPKPTPAPAAGATGATPTPAEAKKEVAPVVETTQITQQELVVIQQDSKVKKATAESATEPVAVEIAALEKQATVTTLKDVQTHDAALYEQIKQNTAENKNMDSDAIQSATVKKIFVTAPSVATEPVKPTLQDLETGGDIYEKYKWEQR